MYLETGVRGHYLRAEAISCFFSVLRQFKIVKQTNQRGEKQTSLKNKGTFARCMDERHT
jgi:hypothetical protein